MYKKCVLYAINALEILRFRKIDLFFNPYMVDFALFWL